MQFRERRRVIQVIRTTYDPALKRGRSTLLGTLDKAAPAITDALRAACTAEELEAVVGYLEGRHGAGPQDLPERMRAAAAYFRTHHDAAALAYAAEIRGAWDELKESMREAGFSKEKLRKAAKAAREPA
jgi:hypothetical protein